MLDATLQGYERKKLIISRQADSRDAEKHARYRRFLDDLGVAALDGSPHDPRVYEIAVVNPTAIGGAMRSYVCDAVRELFKVRPIGVDAPENYLAALGLPLPYKHDIFSKRTAYRPKNKMIGVSEQCSRAAIERNAL